MHIETLQIRNFRRLKDVRIDLASDISIFVGANNSGKTAASHAVQLFTSASREHFSIHDFNVDSWAQIDAFGEEQEAVTLPTISLDIWFRIDEPDLHRVIDLLPSLEWEGSLVGIRVELAAKDPVPVNAWPNISRQGWRGEETPTSVSSRARNLHCNVASSPNGCSRDQHPQLGGLYTYGCARMRHKRQIHYRHALVLLSRRWHGSEIAAT
jgi:hypothetical protein